MKLEQKIQKDQIVEGAEGAEDIDQRKNAFKGRMTSGSFSHKKSTGFGLRRAGSGTNLQAPAQSNQPSKDNASQNQSDGSSRFSKFAITITPEKFNITPIPEDNTPLWGKPQDIADSNSPMLHQQASLDNTDPGLNKQQSDNMTDPNCTLIVKQSTLESNDKIWEKNPSDFSITDTISPIPVKQSSETSSQFFGKQTSGPVENNSPLLNIPATESSERKSSEPIEERQHPVGRASEKSFTVAPESKKTEEKEEKEEEQVGLVGVSFRENFLSRKRIQLKPLKRAGTVDVNSVSKPDLQSPLTKPSENKPEPLKPFGTKERTNSSQANLPSIEETKQETKPLEKKVEPKVETVGQNKADIVPESKSPESKLPVKSQNTLQVPLEQNQEPGLATQTSMAKSERIRDLKLDLDTARSSQEKLSQSTEFKRAAASLHTPQHIPNSLSAKIGEGGQRKSVFARALEEGVVIIDNRLEYKILPLVNTKLSSSAEKGKGFLGNTSVSEVQMSYLSSHVNAKLSQRSSSFRVMPSDSGKSFNLLSPTPQQTIPSDSDESNTLSPQPLQNPRIFERRNSEGVSPSKLSSSFFQRKALSKFGQSLIQASLEKAAQVKEKKAMEAEQEKKGNASDTSKVESQTESRCLTEETKTEDQFFSKFAGERRSRGWSQSTKQSTSKEQTLSESLPLNEDIHKEEQSKSDQIVSQPLSQNEKPSLQDSMPEPVQEKLKTEVKHTLNTIAENGSSRTESENGPTEIELRIENRASIENEGLRSGIPTHNQLAESIADVSQNPTLTDIKIPIPVKNMIHAHVGMFKKKVLTKQQSLQITLDKKDDASPGLNYSKREEEKRNEDGEELPSLSLSRFKTITHNDAQGTKTELDEKADALLEKMRQANQNQADEEELDPDDIPMVRSYSEGALKTFKNLSNRT